MAYARGIRKKWAKKLLNEILETGYFVNCEDVLDVLIKNGFSTKHIDDPVYMR